MSEPQPDRVKGLIVLFSAIHIATVLDYLVQYYGVHPPIAHYYF